MIELNIYISGPSDSEAFRTKLAEVRRLVIEEMAGENFTGLEVKSYETTGPRYPGFPPIPRIQYNSPMSRTPTTLLMPEEPTDAPVAATYGPGSYIVTTRKDAEDVLSKMGAIVDKYSVVMVNDLADMLGLASDLVDINKGWTDLSGAQIKQVRDGWLLDLPTPSIVD